MKIISTLTLLLTLALLPALVQAADPSPADSSPSAKVSQSPKSVPFRGTISTVDAKAGTFTIANKDNTKVRIFSVAKATKLTKEEKDVTLADVKAGDYARGSGLKLDEKTFEVSTAKFGAKTAEEQAADKEKKDKKAAKDAAKAGN